MSIGVMDLEYQTSKTKRYYCRCGIVRSARLYDREMAGSAVLPHEFATGFRELEYCPGGTIDLDADRAP
jgi:hypothetical protein